jgi:hypothetical protein
MYRRLGQPTPSRLTHLGGHLVVVCRVSRGSLVCCASRVVVVVAVVSECESRCNVGHICDQHYK